ncbi:MAG: magnesium transporter CorA family protein [Nevskiales bacterium]
MQCYLLSKGHTPKHLETVDRLPEKGYLWLDFRRDNAKGWQERVRQLTSVTVKDLHEIECFNAGNNSFFDGTPDYDLLVFQGLGPDDRSVQIDTRTVAFIVFDRVLVTIRAADNLSFSVVKDRFEEERLKSPDEPLGLMLLILDTMVDRYLAIRARFTDAVERLENDLLNPETSFDDTRALLAHRRQTRKLEIICNDQLDALDSWRRGTRLTLSTRQSARIIDLREHIRQVLTHVESQQRDIEAAVQLHYSMVAHRTNRIVKTLTLLSAIFLPLTFIVGVYGMNFDFMPELRWYYGYYLVLGGMTLLAGGLLLIFKRRKYF